MALKKEGKLLEKGRQALEILLELHSGKTGQRGKGIDALDFFCKILHHLDFGIRRADIEAINMLRR